LYCTGPWNGKRPLFGKVYSSCVEGLPMQGCPTKSRNLCIKDLKSCSLISKGRQIHLPFTMMITNNCHWDNFLSLSVTASETAAPSLTAVFQLSSSSAMECVCSWNVYINSLLRYTPVPCSQTLFSQTALVFLCRLVAEARD